MEWVPFQVDFNSFGFHRIESAEDWQKFVEGALNDRIGSAPENVLNFILEARGSHPHAVKRVQKEAKAAHSAGSFGSAFGYGIRSDRPSFGYRREHRAGYTLEEWSRSFGMNLRRVAQ